MLGAVAGSPLGRALVPNRGSAAIGAVAVVATVEVSHSAAAVLAGEALPLCLVSEDRRGRLAGNANGMAPSRLGPRRHIHVDRRACAEGCAPQVAQLSARAMEAIGRVMSRIVALRTCRRKPLCVTAQAYSSVPVGSGAGSQRI